MGFCMAYRDLLSAGADFSPLCFPRLHVDRKDSNELWTFLVLAQLYLVFGVYHVLGSEAFDVMLSWIGYISRWNTLRILTWQ
jgi:hypothetical protein